MFPKSSTPLNHRFTSVRGYNNNSSSNSKKTTDKNVVNSRSTSPTPIFRYQVQDSIRIITDVPPPQKSSSQPSASLSSVQINPNHVTDYEKVFSTLYTRGLLKFHSKKSEKPFSLPDELLSEYLTDNQPEKYHGNTTNDKRCTCCLCAVRHRCGNTKICIENHPLNKPCTRDQEMQHKKNTMFKYQKRHICDACMSSLTMNSNKTKTKNFRCHFEPCSTQVKSLKLLRDHYLEHLMVKNFICSMCEKDYKSKNGLKTHERKHASM